MKRGTLLASAAIVCVGLLSGPAGAQVTPQTVELAKVDVTSLSAGYRSTKVVGSSVVNDAGETVGKIDDLLVSPDRKQPFAVISIGGFLGMGTRLVIVPYDALKFADNKVTLPGSTRTGSGCCQSSSTQRSDRRNFLPSLYAAVLSNGAKQ